MNASRSSPRLQSPRLAVAADDLLGPRRLVEADQLLDARADVADVELVGDRVPGDRVAVGVDHDPAVAAVADQADQRGGVVPAAHHLLVLAARPPRHRARDQAGGRLRRLEQEAVAVAEVGELVRERRLRRAPAPAPGARRRTP